MIKRYLLEKPDITFSFGSVELDFLMNDNNFEQLFSVALHSPYLYWDKIKYKKFKNQEPIEKIWAAIKYIRKMNSVQTEIKAETGSYFHWNPKLRGLEKFFHEMDLNTGGVLTSHKDAIADKNKYISRGIIEEAIASSQLEGASTTRKVAKKFLMEGRKAKNNSEQMILNNYKSMKAIEEDLKSKPLSLDLLFELHGMIVKDTVPKDELFRFRKDEDEIVVQDAHGKFIYHVPPKTDFLKKEINRFLDFANDSLGESFLHPIIKAIMLHFWIGYLHPFTDGNGRLARLIFYWYLLKKNYWAFSYLPISTIIKKSPSQYAKAYIYSEQDDLDLTYFIDYNIQKIKLALKDFEKYVERKFDKNKKVKLRAATSYKLNNRQIQLLQYLWENKNEYTTPATHINQYQISKSTAIRDLQDLLKQGFVVVEKSRRKACYYGTDKIKEIFK